MAQFDLTVVGELNLDLILYGLPDELEPEKELLADNLALTLGKPTWVLLAQPTDFRWGIAQSAWYPQAVQFRQPSPGDWRAVLDAVKAKLS